MKKIVALLLAIMMILGCGVIAVSAESSKLLPDLQKALTEKAPDDVIGVYISYKVPVVTAADMPSWPDIYAARKEYFAYTDQMQADIQAQIFEGIDVQVAFQGVHNMVLARVKVSDIEKIASYEIVRDIDYYDDKNDEPDIETEPIMYSTRELWERGAELTSKDIEAAVNEYGGYYYYGADMITIRNSYRFKSTPAYIVDYEPEDCAGFCDVILEEFFFEDYLYYCGCGYEPSIFFDDHLYTLSGAYNAGILTAEMLEELLDVDYTCSAYGVNGKITRNIKGDADGDGDVSIIDATVIQRYEANIPTGAFYKPLADVDGDSDVSIIDATLIQRKEAGLYMIG